jgi:uncharacterized membrane protein YphA (DoxX/SURF4 family)
MSRGATNDAGRRLLRFPISGTFLVHGTHKLFGWFGSYEPDATQQLRSTERTLEMPLLWEGDNS